MANCTVKLPLFKRLMAKIVMAKIPGIIIPHPPPPDFTTRTRNGSHPREPTVSTGSPDIHQRLTENTGPYWEPTIDLRAGHGEAAQEPLMEEVRVGQL